MTTPVKTARMLYRRSGEVLSTKCDHRASCHKTACGDGSRLCRSVGRSPPIDATLIHTKRYVSLAITSPTSNLRKSGGPVETARFKNLHKQYLRRPAIADRDPLGHWQRTPRC